MLSLREATARLIPHHRIIAQHSGEGGTVRQAFHFQCRPIRIRPVSARFQVFSACQFQGMSSSMRLIL